MHKHAEKHFGGTEVLRDVVIGLSDGLTVPFALAAGLTQAIAENKLIVTAGIAEIVAGSIAMGLGGYLAGKTELEHYRSERSRETLEVEKVPELEKQEIRDIFRDYGISAATCNGLVEELAQDQKKWVDFMMKFELDLHEPNPSRPRTQGLAIGVSYAVGGLVPLSAFIFSPDTRSAMWSSSLMTITALFIFGWLKSKLTGQSPLAGAFRMTGIGTLAAAGAFFITRLIS